MCKNSVIEFKKNCHILPRAWAKRTKLNGKNILMDFENNKIAVNQSDYTDSYWCADCEEASSKDDAYGAAVLIHGTKGSVREVRATKVSWKEISAVDYQKLKKFIISIVIRDHLARGLRKNTQIMSDTELELLREEYFGKHDDVFIVGFYILDSEPLSKVLAPPVRTRGNDGTNFQLFNYSFMVYFKRNKPELKPMALKATGEMLLPITTPDKIGNLKDVPDSYQKILDNPKNKKQLENIKKKYH
jgi:hypothetical protein